MEEEPDDLLEGLGPDVLVDRFYRGTVTKLRRGSQSGVIRSAATRRDLPFAFQHVRFVGSHQRYDDLREGMTIGYDVSWTARGLRVSVIFIPDELSRKQPEST